MKYWKGIGERKHVFNVGETGLFQRMLADAVI